MRLRHLLPLCALVAACGCGSSGTVVVNNSVSGQVMMGNTPVTNAVVGFSFPEQGAGASAPVNDSGQFELTAPLPPGKYKITVSPAPVAPPNPGDPEPVIPPSKIPKKYLSPETSGLTADVVVGENKVNLELTP